MSTAGETLPTRRSSVSVLVPTYNRADLLGHAVRSLLQQTVAPLEVIVIDDGSDDDTPGVIRQFGAAVSYLRKDNGGKSSALNLGLEHVRGDRVWILDDDDVALPEAVELHSAALDADPQSGFSYSGYVRGTSDAHGELVAGEEVPAPEVGSDEFLLRLMERNFLRGSAASMVRTACYDEVGGYDIELIRSQDYDMMLRLAERYTPVRVGKPTYCYRLHDRERGSALRRFPGTREHETWREFDQIIFRRVRARLDLGQYLPRAARERLDPEDRRRALLQRMTIMAAKGLGEEALADLKEALAVDCSAPLSTEERAMLHRAVSRPLADDSTLSGSFMRRVRRACAVGIGSEVRRELGKAVYWRLRRAPTTAHRIRLLGALIGVLGIGGLASSATRRDVP